MKASLIPSLFIAVTLLSGSVAVKMDLSDISQAADKVIGGEIVSIEAERDADTGYIYSNVTLAVDRAIPSGLVGQQYSFRMIGGELDGKRVSIQGVPNFSVGDEVILFLNAHSDSVMGATVGIWQGIYFVATNPQTAQQVVLNSSRQAIALTVKGAVASPSMGIEDAAGADAFFERVRQYRQ